MENDFVVEPDSCLFSADVMDTALCSQVVKMESDFVVEPDSCLLT